MGNYCMAPKAGGTSLREQSTSNSKQATQFSSYSGYNMVLGAAELSIGDSTSGSVTNAGGGGEKSESNSVTVSHNLKESHVKISEKTMYVPSLET